LSYRLKGDNKDLKDQLKAQNDRISDLENKFKDHDARIRKRKYYILVYILQLRKHLTITKNASVT
jgi:hypothetical protein